MEWFYPTLPFDYYIDKGLNVMQYTSTRDRSHTFSASQAIAKGLAEDGGLLTPAYLPKLPGKALEDLKGMSYQQRAVYIMKLFLDEFTVKELLRIGVDIKAWER